MTNKISVQCPFCGQHTVTRSEGQQSIDKLKKGIKFVADIFTTVNGYSPNVSNLSSMLVSQDEIGEFSGTECYCTNCRRTYVLKSRWNGYKSRKEIDCNDEKAPVNIEKRRKQKMGKYTVIIKSAKLGFWTKEYYLNDLIDVADVFEDDAVEMLKQLPITVKFTSIDDRNEFIKRLQEKKDCIYIVPN